MSVDDGESSALLVVKILGNVEASLVASLAKRTTTLEGFIGPGTCGAMTCVAREGFHDEKFIIMRQP